MWVANVDAGTITRVDPETNKVIATFAGGLFNEGLVAKDDRVWLAITGMNQVAPIDVATNTVGEPVTVGQSPRRMLIRDDGLWVTNTDAGTISVVPDVQ